jgi:hypothetical protein
VQLSLTLLSKHSNNSYNIPPGECGRLLLKELIRLRRDNGTALDHTLVEDLMKTKLNEIDDGKRSNFTNATGDGSGTLKC